MHPAHISGPISAQLTIGPIYVKLTMGQICAKPSIGPIVPNSQSDQCTPKHATKHDCYPTIQNIPSLLTAVQLPKDNLSVTAAVQLSKIYQRVIAS